MVWYCQKYLVESMESAAAVQDLVCLHTSCLSMESSFMMLRAYARHAVLESLHAGSGKECGELRCSAAKPALLEKSARNYVVVLQSLHCWIINMMCW